MITNAEFRDRLSRAIEISAWVGGSLLIVVFGALRLGTEAVSAQGIATFRATRDASEPALHAQATEGADGDRQRAVDKSLWSAQRIAAYAQSLSEITTPEGVLQIPSLQLEVPIYQGTGEIALNLGAGHIEGTSALGADGNIGLAAHRDGFFRTLKDIAIDTDIFLELEHRTLHYRVVDISIVEPADVYVLAPTRVPSVTLVTCHPFYFVGSAPDRYIVRAQLADAPNVAQDASL